MLLGIRWSSLRTKIVVWAFVPTAIILVAVALVTFTAYQQVTEDLVIERNQELTRLSAGQLATGLAEYADTLAAQARTTGTYGHPAAQRIVLQRARDRLAVFDGGVLILDTFGTVVATEPERPEVLGQNWSDHPYYRQMLRTPGPVFSDIVADGPGGTEVIVVAVPIIGPQDEFLGTIAGMFRLDTSTVSAFYADIVKLRLGESGGAYLVDGKGQVIYHSDTGRIGEDFSAQAVVGQALNGQVGAIRTRDLEGRDIVASFAPVPSTSWGLVTEESWAALISPSQGYRQFLLLLLVLGVVVPALVVAVGVRRITSPIRELIGAAQAVAGGDFDQKITAHTGDEVGELAEQFSLMSAQLQESYANLERRVADRTKELATLNAIAAVVSRSLDLDETLSNALDKVLEVLEFESGAIYLKGPKAGELQLAHHRGLSEAFRRVVAKGIISARAAETSNPIIVDDLPQEPNAPKEVVEEGYRSVASIPLLSKGQVHGVLTIASRQLRYFHQQDVDLLLSLGHQIGVGIENARLFEAERQRRQEATLLAEMAKLISGTLDLDEVLRLSAEYAVEVFDVHCCCIFLYNEEKGTLRSAVQIGSDDQLSTAIAGVEFIPSERMQRKVLEGFQPLIIEDVPSDPHLSPQHLLDLQSALVVPIEVGGRRLGAMQLGTHPPRRRRFTADEGELALAMANQAAVAIEGARLFKDEQRRAEQFRVISEVGRHTTSILAVDELLGQIARLIKETLNYYAVGIGLVEGGEVVFRAGVGAFWDETQLHQSLRLKVGQEGFTGWVAQSGEALLVPDVSQDPRYYYAPQASKTQSELVVPVKIKGVVIGVLGAQSDRLNAFDESDLVMLQSLADQAAVAIENARLFIAEQRRAEQFRVISEVGRRITSILAVDELLEQMVGLIQKAFNYYLVEIGLVEEDEIVFKARAGRDWDPQFESFRLKVGEEGITGWVAATGEPLLVPDVNQEPRYVKVTDTETHSELAVPIKVKEKVTGVINVESDRPDAFDESDVAVLQSLAHQAAIAIENARLFKTEQRRAEEFRVISEVGRHITSILAVDELLEEIARLLKETLGYYLVGIALAEGDELIFRAGAGAVWETPEFQPPRLKVGQEGITGWVAQSGEPLLVPDVSQEPRYYSIPQASEIRSELAVALKTKETVIGVLHVQSDQPNAFNESDLAVLQSLAHQAAIAIDNARLFKAEQRRAEEFRVISEVGRRITSILDVDELLDQMARLIQEAFNYYQVGFGLIEGDELISKAGAGRLRDAYQSLRLKVGQEGIGGWVAAAGEPLLVPDVSQEPRYYFMPEAAETCSELCVPLKAKGAVIGVLDVQSDQPNAFDESDLAVLQSLAHQAAIAIENARLLEQARQVATLEERQRLARELHDSVTQALYGVTLYAEAAARLLAAGEAELASDHLREVRHTGQEALREMRLLIFELRPPVLEQEGLVAALEVRLEAVEGRSGLETGFNVEGELRLPPDIEEGLYRIAQEALNNALKHAQAHRIAVHLRQDERSVMLEIADDGIGVDPTFAREQAGMGLPGMEERAARLEGRLTLESGPGEGTSVRVEVDL